MLGSPPTQRRSKVSDDEPAQDKRDGVPSDELVEVLQGVGSLGFSVKDTALTT